MRDKKMVLDGMMGLVVGDALGCPVQFRSRKEIRNREKGPVTGMEGYGTFNMPVGSWTDDSSMALATLDSINRKGSVDLKDIMDAFVRWDMDGAYTPFGYPYDQGLTCTDAIFKYMKTGDPLTCARSDENANGNGGLMRILPVCLYLVQRQSNICTSDDEAIEIIHRVTGLTHNHLRSHMASGLYFFMVKAIVRGKCSGRPISALLQEGLDEGMAYYGHDLRNLSERSNFSRLFDLDSFRKVPESEIRGSGYVLHTLEAVVWSLLQTDNFKDCLLTCVNLGEDTDTVAAIAGGLAGLYYGYEAMPEEWLEVIQKREWVEEICRG